MGGQQDLGRPHAEKGHYRRAQEAGAVAAGLQNAHVAWVKRQKGAVRLNGARDVYRLPVAIGQINRPEMDRVLAHGVGIAPPSALLVGTCGIIAHNSSASKPRQRYMRETTAFHTSCPGNAGQVACYPSQDTDAHPAEETGCATGRVLPTRDYYIERPVIDLHQQRMNGSLVETFIAQHNIVQFEKLLRNESDPTERRILESMLREERARLAEAEARPGVAGRYRIMQDTESLPC
jgi:hypothetical protein